jgi:hypothetical protein
MRVLSVVGAVALCFSVNPALAQKSEIELGVLTLT